METLHFIIPNELLLCAHDFYLSVWKHRHNGEIPLHDIRILRPQSRDVDKLIAAHLVNKFPAFNLNRIFNPVLYATGSYPEPDASSHDKEYFQAWGHV